jgi:hypothetical protein
VTIARLRAAAARLAQDLAAQRAAPAGPTDPRHMTNAELLEVVFPGRYPPGMSEAEAVRAMDALPVAVLEAAAVAHSRVGIATHLLIKGESLPPGLTESERRQAEGYFMAIKQVVGSEQEIRLAAEMGMTPDEAQALTDDELAARLAEHYGHDAAELVKDLRPYGTLAEGGG